MERDLIERQFEKTLARLEHENRRLKEEIRRRNAGAAAARHLRTLHHNLEKDFFVARNFEELIFRLNNRLLILPEIDFVCVCLRQRYLEGILGRVGWEAVAAELDAPLRVGYLQLLEESLFRSHLAPVRRTLYRKTPSGGAGDIYFALHGDQVRSLAIVPLMLRGEGIGSLNIGSVWSRHFYDAAPDREILDRLGAKLAIAVDNLMYRCVLAVQKKRLERDVGAAAILQRSLIAPPRPEISGFEGMTGFYPCQRLGGDFIDIFPVGSQRVGAVIADAAGHGISAALMVAMLKFSLQMDGMARLPATEAVARINARFTRILRRQDYLTLCYVLLDSRRGRMELVRAGHPYPLLSVSGTSEVRELKPAGPPVGLESEALYVPCSLRLNAGDRLLLYTDGLAEALDASGESAEGGADFLRLRFGDITSLEGFAKTMEQRLDGRTLSDDASFLMLRYRPER